MNSQSLRTYRHLQHVKAELYVSSWRLSFSPNDEQSLESIKDLYGCIKLINERCEKIQEWESLNDLKSEDAWFYFMLPKEPDEKMRAACVTIARYAVALEEINFFV